MPENTTPDTAAYLFLGLAVTALVMGAYIARIVLGFRRAAKDEAALEAISES